MRMNLTRIIHMDYENLLSAAGGALTAVFTVALPGYIVFRNHVYKIKQKIIDLKKQEHQVELDIKEREQVIDNKEHQLELDMKEREQVIEGKEHQLELDMKERVQVIDIKAQDHLLLKMERLMQIERENYQEMIRKERESNELARHDRAELHKQDVKRLEKRLETNEQKTSDLEAKERACGELTIKLENDLKHQTHKTNNQATMIVALQDKIKALEDQLWTGRQS